MAEWSQTVKGEAIYSSPKDRQPACATIRLKKAEKKTDGLGKKKR